MFEECLYFNSNALARTVTRIWADAYKPFDLSPPHAFALRMVLAKPGIMPSELAEGLHLSRSTVTRFLDSLEKRQMIERYLGDEDGRELQIYPTKAAQRIHQQLDDTGRALSKRMAELFGKDDLSSTVAQMREFQSLLES